MELVNMCHTNNPVNDINDIKRLIMLLLRACSIDLLATSNYTITD